MDDIEWLAARAYDAQAQEALVTIGAPVVERLIDAVRKARHPFLFSADVVEVFARIDPAPVERLSALLSDAQPDLRTIAKQSLERLKSARGEMGRLRAGDVATIEALRNTTDLGAAWNALHLFAQGGLRNLSEDDFVGIFRRIGPAAIAPLTADLQDHRVRGIAIKILARLGPLSLEALGSTLRDPSPRLREMAAVALANTGEPTAVAPLISALRDVSIGVRLAAIHSLARFDEDGRAAEALITALHAAEHSIRYAALRALWPFGDLAVEALVGALGDSAKDIRLRTMEILANIADRPVAETTAAGAPDPSDRLRHSAMQALSKSGARRAAIALLGVLRDPDPEIRAAAADALGRFPRRSVVETLIATLNSDSSPAVREAAADALGQIGHPQAVEALLEQLATRYTDLHRSVRRALKKIGAPYAVVALIGALKSENPRLRADAAAVLGNIGHRRAVEPLIVCLRDIHPDVRANVILALESLGDPRALPELEQLAKSDKRVSEHGCIADIAGHAVTQIQRGAPSDRV